MHPKRFAKTGMSATAASLPYTSRSVLSASSGCSGVASTNVSGLPT